MTYQHHVIQRHDTNIQNRIDPVIKPYSRQGYLIMSTTSIGRGIIKRPMSVCSSVCPSVARLDLTRERKGLGSPKLAG